MKNIITTIILLIMTSPVFSAETWLDINVTSVHSVKTYVDIDTGDETVYNNKNYGIGLSIDNIRVGFYKNSFYKQSVYAGYNFDMFNVSNRLSVGVTCGVVSGYTDTTIKTPTPAFIPMVLPHMTYKIVNKVRVVVGLIPAEVPVLTLTFGIKF